MSAESEVRRPSPKEVQGKLAAVAEKQRHQRMNERTVSQELRAMIKARAKEMKQIENEQEKYGTECVPRRNPN